MTTGYDPPVTAGPSRLQLARDILAVHKPRLALWRERCTTCRCRWPCPQAQWATDEAARQPPVDVSDQPSGDLDVRVEPLRAGRRDRWSQARLSRRR